jgi:hypothetical protein
MPCMGQKVAVGGALIGLGGSGVIAVVGAPTGVLTAAGIGVALASLVGLITALTALRDCYEANERFADAQRVNAKLELLEAQVAALRRRLGDA